MKKLVYLLSLALLVGCQQPPADMATVLQPVDKDALQTEKDKVSYIIGVNFGHRLKADQVDIDLLKFAKGLQDGLGDDTALLLDEKDINETMTAFQQKMTALYAAQKKEAADKALAASQAYLEENKAKEGVVTTDSGLQYKVLTEGTGPIPTADDHVVCHYTGKLTDGQVFDSSFKRGEPAVLPVSGVIPGWTEALLMMKTGSKWEITMPPSLAYGEQGAPPVIPPHAALVFEVELINIQGKTDNPVDTAAPAPATNK